MSSMILERPQSSASSRSGVMSDNNIDWDRFSAASTSRSPSEQPVTPSPSTRRLELPNVDTTPMNKSSLSNRGHGTGYQPRRSLADLLSAHGEKGRENVESLHITEDEEDMLREALDNWINSEDDDRSFHHDVSPSSRGSSPQSMRGPSTFDTRTRSPVEGESVESNRQNTTA